MNHIVTCVMRVDRKFCISFKYFLRSLIAVLASFDLGMGPEVIGTLSIYSLLVAECSLCY
jgi:hypothetical protein